MILTSPLVRTRQTADILLHGLRGRPEVIDWEPLEPERRPKDVLTALKSYREYTSLALVAHEPGIGDLAAGADCRASSDRVQERRGRADRNADAAARRGRGRAALVPDAAHPAAGGEDQSVMAGGASGHLEQKAAELALLRRAMRVRTLVGQELAHEPQAGLARARQELLAIEEPAGIFGVVARRVRALNDDERRRAMHDRQPRDVDIAARGGRESAQDVAPGFVIVQRAACEDQIVAARSRECIRVGVVKGISETALRPASQSIGKSRA